MSLFEALNVLCRTHTRDDTTDGLKFIVDVGAIPDFANRITMQEYVQAWSEVRRAIGRSHIEE